MENTLIDRFAAGGPRLRQAIAGLSAEDLVAHPGPGDWSVHELVIHLADSDAIAIDRMKRILTEDNPTLLRADETAYMVHLHCEAQSFDDALTLFEVARRQMARVLRCLPPETFHRAGTHNVAGNVTLEDLVRSYADHLDHHMEFLLAKRQRLGKPLPQS